MAKRKKTTIRKLEAENVVHHIHHREGEEEAKREVCIGGATCSISMASSYPKENITFLCNKSLELYKKIKAGDNKI